MQMGILVGLVQKIEVYKRKGKASRDMEVEAERRKWRERSFINKKTPTLSTCSGTLVNRRIAAHPKSCEDVWYGRARKRSSFVNSSDVFRDTHQPANSRTQVLQMFGTAGLERGEERL